jgi:hypothetical protein
MSKSWGHIDGPTPVQILDGDHLYHQKTSLKWNRRCYDRDCPHLCYAYLFSDSDRRLSGLSRHRHHRLRYGRLHLGPHRGHATVSYLFLLCDVEMTCHPCILLLLYITTLSPLLDS